MGRQRRSREQEIVRVPAGRDHKRNREADPTGQDAYVDDDALHYDEPTRNGVRYRRVLPVTSFFVGSQLGDIGLCNDNIASYYENAMTAEVLRPSVLNTLLGTEHSRYPGRAKLERRFVHIESGTVSEQPRVPAPTDASIRLNAGDVPFPVHELQTTGESLYLFREGSAAAWVNSIEAWVDPGDGEAPVDHAATLGRIYEPCARPAALPFSAADAMGVLGVSGQDACIDYGAQAEVEREFRGDVIEQRGLDLGAAASLSVEPAGRLESTTGEFVARIGKGLPETPFVPPVHTKTYVDFDDGESVWQAHPYCHRPLIVSYELERDLSEAEIEAWNEAPPQLAVVPYMRGLDGVGGRVRVEVLIREATQATEGTHVRLVYLTTPYCMRIGVEPQELFDVAGPSHRNSQEVWSFNYRADVHDFSTLRPIEDGLFAGGPVISADYLTLPELREEQLAYLRQQYGLKEAQITGSFLLSLIPDFGDVASTTFEALMDQVGQGSFARVRGASVEIVKTVLGIMFGKKSAIGEGVSDGLGTAKGAATMLRRTESTLGRISEQLSNWASPFRLGQDGLQPKDAVVLMAGERQRRRLTCTPDGIDCTRNQGEGDVAVVYDRTVDPGEAGSAERPYHIPMGPTASRIERGDTAEATRMANSIAEPMDAFLTAVRETERMADDIFDGQSQMGSAQHREGLTRVVERLTAPGHTPALNENLMAYMRTSETLRTSLDQPFSPDDDEAGAAEAFAHLWMSIDLSITRCPACERLMDPNWGWCPYHADPVFFRDEVEIAATTEDAFQLFIQNDNRFKDNLDIVDHLNSELSKQTRLFVHWTEFEVFRSVTASNDNSDN